MKYNLVRISPNFDGDKFDIYFEEVEGDREESGVAPNPQGFYYYPATMSRDEALGKLKEVIVDAHLKEISNLEHSVKMLLAVSV